MSAFDPRKYHGRSLNEVVRTLDGNVRGALEEARAAYRFCLQKDEPVPAGERVRPDATVAGGEATGPARPVLSQAGQDRYLNERIFRNRRNGTFVEIGGHDGWTGSNCVFFEKVLGWTGIVVEASPRLVKQIGRTRSAAVVNAAVSDRDGTAEFLDVTSGLTQMSGLVDHYPGEMLRTIRQDERHAETVVTVPSMRLDTLRRAHGLDRIDYCSIDVEGAERAVLGSIDFEAADIAVLSIENNRSGPEPASYEDILGPTGYRQVAVLGMDEIWAKRAE